MPKYSVGFELVDSQGRSARKSFNTVTLADEAAALAAAAGLATDIGNLSQLRILAYTVSQRVVYTDTYDAGANRDEGVTLVLRKANNYKDVIKMFGPISTIFDGQGNVDMTHVAVSAFVSNFLTGGDFEFSDGEQGTELVGGTWDK